MNAGMKLPIILLFVLLVAVIFACDDKEKIVGCNFRNHIYTDRLYIGTEHDTVHLFLAAGAQQEYLAPVTFDLSGTDDFSDSMIVKFSVYGESGSDDPRPYKEIIWRSDTLIIWYSGSCCYSDLMLLRSLHIPSTPPCPVPYYRIDHIDIRHSNDVVVETHEDILY